MPTYPGIVVRNGITGQVASNESLGAPGGLVTTVLDTAIATGLSIGATTASAITLGKAGVATTIGGNLVIQSSIDTGTANSLYIGGTVAPIIYLGRAGHSTLVQGFLSVSNILTIKEAGIATAGVTSYASHPLRFTYTYWNGSSATYVHAFTIRVVPSAAANLSGDLVFTDQTTVRAKLIANTSKFMVDAVDCLTASGTLSLGTSAATNAVTIGRAGTTTTIAGNLSVSGTETVIGGMTFGSQINFGPVGSATSVTQTQNSILTQYQYAYWNGSSSVTTPGYAIRATPDAVSAGTGHLSFLKDGTTEVMRLTAEAASKLRVENIDAFGTALNIGTTYATSIYIGGGSAATSIEGPVGVLGSLTVDDTITASGGLDVSGGLTVNNGGATISNGGLVVGSGLATFQLEVNKSAQYFPLARFQNTDSAGYSSIDFMNNLASNVTRLRVGVCGSTDAVFPNKAHLLYMNSTGLVLSHDGSTVDALFDSNGNVKMLSDFITGAASQKRFGIGHDVINNPLDEHIIFKGVQAGQDTGLIRVQNSASNGDSSIAFYDALDKKLMVGVYGGYSTAIDYQPFLKYQDNFSILEFDNTVAMKFNANGYVGLGVNPAYPLDISRAMEGETLIHLRNTVASQYTGIAFHDNANNPGLYIGVAGTTSANAYNAIIRYAGNLLQIYNGTNKLMEFVDDSSIFVTSNASSFEVQTWLSAFGFSADSSTLYVDNTVHKVGIGTTGPFGTEKMLVQGNLKISGNLVVTGGLTLSGAFSASSFTATITGGGGSFIAQQYSATSVAMYTGNWPSSSFWGIGYNSNANTVQIGIVTSLTSGTWSGSQTGANLQIGGMLAAGSVALGYGTTLPASPLSLLKISGNGPTSASSTLTWPPAAGNNCYIYLTEGNSIATGTGPALVLGSGNTANGGFAAIRGYAQSAGTYMMGDLSFLCRPSTSAASLSEVMRIPGSASSSAYLYRPLIISADITQLTAQPATSGGSAIIAIGNSNTYSATLNMSVAGNGSYNIVCYGTTYGGDGSVWHTYTGTSTVGWSLSNSSGVEYAWNSGDANIIFRNRGSTTQNEAVPEIELVQQGPWTNTAYYPMALKISHEPTTGSYVYSGGMSPGGQIFHGSSMGRSNPAYPANMRFQVNAVSASTFNIVAHGSETNFVNRYAGWRVYSEYSGEYRWIRSNNGSGRFVVDTNWVTGPSINSYVILYPPIGSNWYGGSVFASALVWNTANNAIYNGYNIASTVWSTTAPYTCTVSFREAAIGITYTAIVSPIGSTSSQFYGAQVSARTTTSVGVTTFNNITASKVGFGIIVLAPWN